MRRLLSLLAIAPLLLAGCSSLELPGSATYFANSPNGEPFFKVTSGMGTPKMAVSGGGGVWTPAEKMEPLKLTEPPVTLTPGLSDILQSAYRIDSYLFFTFKPGARVSGKFLPSRYFLQPGGFAYPVPAPKAAGH
ncbi:MAG: hypothetical protein ACREKL_06235 [Chthoniobacterales bacterium]